MADARLGLLISAKDAASGVIQGIGKELGSLDKQITARGLGDQLGGIAKTALGFTAAGALANLTSGAGDQLKEIVGQTVSLTEATRKLQLMMGGSAESASSLIAVFDRFGVGADAGGRALTIFDRGLRGDIDQLELGQAGGKSFNATLAELGIRARDSAGNVRPMQEVLGEVADAFNRNASDGENGARSMALFGRGGRDMLPVLALGKQGMSDLADEAKKLGIVLSQDNVDATHKYVMEMKTATERIEGYKLRIGLAVTSLAGATLANAEVRNKLEEESDKRMESDIAHLGALKDSWVALATEIINAGKAQLGMAPAADILPVSEAAIERHNQATRDIQRFSEAGQQRHETASTAGMLATEQPLKLAHDIAEAERINAVIQHDISLKTRENLDLKRSEAEIQLQMLPLKAQQADIEQQLLIATDKRVSLERDAAVMRAQMASNASADALEGLNFEEQRLKLKIKADALSGRGVAQGDIAALMQLALSKPGAELGALEGGRGATLAERDRQRAQQAQDLANIPLREQQADNERQQAELSRASAAVQRQIEEARLRGTIDTTDLEKQKRALDDRIFDNQQKLADIKGPISLNITQTITATGEIDYDRVIQATQDGVFGALREAQTTAGAPPPAFSPGSRGPGLPSGTF